MKYINRHYTKLWIIALILLPASAVAARIFYAGGYDYRFTIIAVIIAIADIALIIKLLLHPIKIMYRFMGCIMAKERNTHFLGSKDALLGPLTEKMNSTLLQNSKERENLEKTLAYNERIMRVMSHELRNSISPIISLSASNGEDTKENMQVIHSQATAINEFVNAFHRLSNIPTPRMQEVNITELFKKLAHLLRNEKGKCALQFTAPQEFTIKADTNQLTLILVNLLRNSFQVLEGREDGKIEVRASSSGGKKYITVRDNGTGIPAEHMEHIFEPFYSTKEGGTGIGLPLSRQIMFLHGGDLQLLSNHAGNTIFILQF